MSGRTRGALSVAALAIVVVLLGGAVLCEGVIRVSRPPSSPQVENPIPLPGVNWQPATIRSSDGVSLRGWLFTPAAHNGGCVIVLHGIHDSKRSQLAFARFLLDGHYAVLLPDSRGHGESGEALVTYGLRESSDVERWARWLREGPCRAGLYGLGESLGAAVLLQTLPRGHLFQAVVAESSFADFGRIGAERVAQRLHLPLPVGRPLMSPIVWAGFAYAQLRYGIDFHAASPQDAIAQAETPVLLIHGLNDNETPPEHSRILAARAPRGSELWLVNGAGHTGAWSAAGEEFPRRVLDWFRTHSSVK